MATLYLTLNGIDLNRRGFCTVDRSLIRLLGGASTVDVNQKLPYVPGRVSFDQIIDQTVYDLEALVEGKRTYAGVAHTDEVDGKVANLTYLRTNIADPAATTMTAVLHTAAGNITVDAQVANWIVGRDNGASAKVAFDLIVPAGAFA